MSVLDFALGSGLKASVSIAVFFTVIRLSVMLAHAWRHNNAPAKGSAMKGALFTVFRRFWPMRSFQQATQLGQWLGYLSHIGLAVVVFGGVFHIEFIQGLLGVAWPSLPPPVISFAAVTSLAAFVGLLIRRLMDPVVRTLSTVDDYLSWTVTVLPLLTGLLLGYSLYGGITYETMLGIHVLSFELLLIWLPFGKLIHTFTFIPSRAMTGATYGQRGIDV